MVSAILAVIAIPTFLHLTHKAVDASAKTVAYDAQNAADTYGTEHAGGYLALTVAALRTDDPSIPITGPGVYLASANGTTTGYVVTTASTSVPEVFTIKDDNGTVTRTCLPAVGTNGECTNGIW